MRRDVERNRAALLVAGAAVFARAGLDATLDDVASEAGLGSGTAYRHFGSRNGLVRAVFSDVAEKLIAEAEAGNGTTGTGGGLEGFVRTLAERMAADRGLYQVLAGAQIDCLTQDQWSRLIRAIGSLLTKAQESGDVDPAIETSDVLLFVAGLGPTIDLGAAAGIPLWRRQCELFLRSLAADGANRQAPATPTVGAAALTELLAGIAATT